MDLSQTTLALGVTLAVAALALWRAHQPWQPGRLWRIPWHAVLALALVLMLGLLAHIASLLTGQPVTPRGFGGR